LPGSSGKKKDRIIKNLTFFGLEAKRFFFGLEAKRFIEYEIVGIPSKRRDFA
jgi:hypothetical protein